MQNPFLAILGLSLVSSARADGAGRLTHHRRDTPTISTNLPESWSYVGCFVDSVDKPILCSEVFTDRALTETSCINNCTQLGYNYAGVEWGWECHCGYWLPADTITNSTDCNQPCVGDASEICGGEVRLSLFTTSRGPPKVNGWAPLGCFPDNPFSRTLSGDWTTVDKLSVENCTSTCLDKGFSLAGVEYGNECFCGNTINNDVTPIESSNCNMLCTGNINETCGGTATVNIYQHLAVSPNIPDIPVTPTTTSAPATSATTTCDGFFSGTSLDDSSATDPNHWSTISAMNIDSSISGLTYTGCPSIMLQPIEAGTTGSIAVLSHPVVPNLVVGNTYSFTFYQGRPTSAAPTNDLGGAQFAAGLGLPLAVFQLDELVACSASGCPFTAADGSVWQRVNGFFVYSGEDTILFQAVWGSDTQPLLLTGFEIQESLS